MDHVNVAGANGLLGATSWTGLEPVVLLHAGGERRSVWDPIAPTIAAASGRRVLAVDQRGHGDSAQAGPTDRLDGFIADVGRVLAYVGSPAVLVGSSLGGFAALGAAWRWRHRVAAIVLVDVVPNLDPQSARDYLATAAGGRFADSALVDDILARIAEMEAWAADLAIPVLLVRGERSHLEARAAVELRGLCPQLAVEVVAGAGHLVASDQPGRLAVVLARFLSGGIDRASPCPGDEPGVASRSSGTS
jgi:pimeloyl-ACP methyl ester carboxylesterase